MIIIVRHGEAEHNVKKVFDSNLNSKSYLTDFGIKQIEISSQRLVNFLTEFQYKVDRIYCSPLIRTIQSARIMRDCLYDNSLFKDDRFCIDYNLKEIEMGSFDTKLITEYPHKPYDFECNDEFGGESSFDVQKRIKFFLNGLRKSNVNLIVTHGEPFRQIYYNYLKKEIFPKRGQVVIIDTLTKKAIYDSEENN